MTAILQGSVAGWPSAADVAGLWASSGWPSVARRPGPRAELVAYGDFTCPYSFLASQRVDALRRVGSMRVEWRAVEHDPAVPVGGRPSAPQVEAWERKLAEVAAAALPGEIVPRIPPRLISNTAAAVAMYAGATEWFRPRVRPALFEEVWVRLRPVDRVGDVRRVFGDLGLAEPRPPEAGTGQAAWWRQEWLELPRPMVPAVLRPEVGIVTVGVDALAYLAGLLSVTTRHP